MYREFTGNKRFLLVIDSFDVYSNREIETLAYLKVIPYKKYLPFVQMSRNTDMDEILSIPKKDFRFIPENSHSMEEIRDKYFRY